MVKNFLNADFFEELYDDPLSYFTDKDRKSDEVGFVKVIFSLFVTELYIDFSIYFIVLSRSSQG